MSNTRYPRLDKLPQSVRLDFDADRAVSFTFLDQRLLPQKLEFVSTSDWLAVIDAIKTLAVRGAPAIGVAGAAAVTLWAADTSHDLADFESACSLIANARPTAVNLNWAVAQAREVLAEELSLGQDREAVVARLVSLEHRLEDEDRKVNKAIGDNGAQLLQKGTRVLTHCNAGSLATVFYGTALGVVYSAAAQGKIDRVYSDETRPLGQGVRLTCWELARTGIPVTALCDNMAASLMAKGMVDVVIVGADRIAANGDAANKIGTYGVAVLAKHHGIPFYVAAPLSTFDFSLADGSSIPIEQRAAQEVMAQSIEGVEVYNPAFDVTPAELITGIITEKGVFAPSDLGGLRRLAS